MPSPARADRRLAALALVAAAVAALPGCGGGDGGASSAKARTIVVDVPRGAAARIARGEDLDVVPDRIDARVGDTLRLVNRDVRSHMVGPFLVGPGQRVESRLARAGTYAGACTLHADRREVTIVVQER
jgi:plastocyanin